MSKPIDHEGLTAEDRVESELVDQTGTPLGQLSAAIVLRQISAKKSVTKRVPVAAFNASL